MAVRLLNLPYEVRLLIWEDYLSSTKLLLDYKLYPPNSLDDPSPHPNPLNILYVNRQVYCEVRALIESLVMFSFYDTAGLFDRLSLLPDSQLARIRHLEIRACPVTLNPFEHSTLKLVDALTLLPALTPPILSLYCNWELSDFGWKDDGDDDIGLIAWQTFFDFILLGHHDPSWTELRSTLPMSAIIDFLIYRCLYAAETNLYTRMSIPSTCCEARGGCNPEQIKRGFSIHEHITKSPVRDPGRCITLENGIVLTISYECLEPWLERFGDGHYYVKVVAKRDISVPQTIFDSENGSAASAGRSTGSGSISRLPDIYKGLSWQQIKHKARPRLNFVDLEDNYYRHTVQTLWDEDPFADPATHAM